MTRPRGFPSLAVACYFTVLAALSTQAQTGSKATPVVTQSIDESKVVTLKGNTRPEANSKNDRGPVASDLLIEHMLLQLRRSPAQEQALKQFIDELHTPGSPNFHQWLTPQQFGEQFGLAQQDLDTVSHWLESHGFTVNVVYPSGILIDFSGTAGQVRAAFHTEIHQLEVNGTKHIANMRDPQIPAALAPGVAGIVSLHDFRPHPMVKLRGHEQYTFNDILGSAYAVVPGDLGTIYNFNPLFSSGISGQGQSIVAIEDGDIYSPSDWTTFRSTFGLSGYTSGSLTQIHPAPPSGSNNCSDPGVIGTTTNPVDAEAILDAEYASAAAPSAAIVLASCQDTSTTFGGLIAIQNLINTSGTVPSIISVSYGECEAANGLTANAAYNSTYQQAVTEGVSVYVAAGDSGAAGCDQGQSAATQGIAVNGFASTPYNVAVGGTDFGDTYAGTNATYWNSGNSPAYASALSYIPEIPWNDSCAGALFAAHEGYSVYGSGSLCNAGGGFLASLLGVLTTAAGGGGPSNCAIPSNTGPCAGYPKPSWQTVYGNPCGANCGSSTNDGVRDTPDVSLFAAAGLWGHYYIFCFSDPADGGAACSGAPSGWAGGGGTSFASPIMAGVQALINQKTGSPQGNPNPALYSLAAREYGLGGNSSCNSNLGNTVASSCPFYDVTLGDMAVDCTGNQNCFDSSAGYGVLSTSNNAYKPAYSTAPGWDFATGIGSVNVTNLVNNWTSGPNFWLSTSPTNVTITQGTSSNPITITVNPQNGFTGSVSLSASLLPTGVAASFNPTSATTTSTLTLTANATATTGTFSITVTGVSGSLQNTAQISTQIVTRAATSTSLTSAPNPSISGTGVTFTARVTPGTGPTGSITFMDGTTTLGAGPLNSGGQATFTTSNLAVGLHTITAVYGGDVNFSSSTSPAIAQTVNPLSLPGPANGYSYQGAITIHHTQVPNTDQTNFPVLISGTYSYLATAANGGNVQRTDGSGNALDLIFTSDSGCSSPLNFEIESYVGATGQIAYWVEVPGLSHTSDTVFYLCYGNSSVTSSQANASGTWDSNFKAVIHFASSTSISGADSTSAGNNLTNSGATAGTGLIGGAAVTVANSAYLYRSNPTGFPSGTSPRTLETWFKKSDGNTAGEEIVGYGNNTVNGDRFAVYFGSGALYVETRNDGRGFSWSNDGNWHHIALVLPSGGSKSSDVLMYLDGVLQSASGGSLTLATSTADFAVGTIAGYHGNAGFNGLVDEVRVSNTARSADWIATEYNNQSSPSTFYAIGGAASPK